MTLTQQFKLDRRFGYIAAELDLLAQEIRRAGIGLEVHVELNNARHHLRTARANFGKSHQSVK